MSAQKTDQLATELFDKIAKTAAENGRLKRAIKVIRTLGENGLVTAAGDGAVAWRDALQKIVEVTKNA